MSHDNRTLQPTAQRRRQARLEGRVAVSGQVTATVVWLAFAGAVAVGGRHGLASTEQLFRELWATPYSSRAIGPSDALWLAARVVVPALLLIVAAAAIGRLAQIGVVWLPQRILPRLSRVNPSSRLMELISPGKLQQAVMTGVLSLGGCLLVSWGIWSQRSELVWLITTADLEAGLLQQLSSWGIRLGIFLVVFAAFDFAFQRYRFDLSLRMSPEELRAEIKAIEGHPQVASGRREMRREIRDASRPRPED